MKRAPVARRPLGRWDARDQVVGGAYFTVQP